MRVCTSWIWPALAMGCIAGPSVPRDDGSLDLYVPEGADPGVPETADEPVPENRCAPPDGALTSDADLRAFATCTAIDGSLHVTGDGITDLSPLHNVREVTGSLLIGPTTRLDTLDGLDGLQWVGQMLVLQDNDALSGTMALPRLRSAASLIAFGSGDLIALETGAVVDELELHSLPALTVMPGVTVAEDLQLVGLPELTHWGDLSVRPTTTEVRVHGTNLPDLLPLADVDALDVLSVVDGPSLRSVDGTEALTRATYLVLDDLPVSDDLTLSGLPALPDTAALAGLSGLDVLELGGHQPGLDLSGLAHLEHIGTSLRFSNSGPLDLTPLSGLTSVGRLDIQGGGGLDHLDGLDGLVSAGGVMVSGTRALVSLAGLSSLQTVTGDFMVVDNADLQVFGVDALTQVDGGLAVVSNPNLDVCDVDLDAFGAVHVSNSGNAPCPAE